VRYSDMRPKILENPVRCQRIDGRSGARCKNKAKYAYWFHLANYYDSKGTKYVLAAVCREHKPKFWYMNKKSKEKRNGKRKGY